MVSLEKWKSDLRGEFETARGFCKRTLYYAVFGWVQFFIFFGFISWNWRNHGQKNDHAKLFSDEKIGTLEIMASFYHGILTMVNIFNSQSQFWAGNINSDFFLSFLKKITVKVKPSETSLFLWNFFTFFASFIFVFHFFLRKNTSFWPVFGKKWGFIFFPARIWTVS